MCQNDFVVALLLRKLFRIKPYRGSRQTRSVKPLKHCIFSSIIKIQVGNLA